MGREHRVYLPYSRAAHGVSFYCLDVIGAFFSFLLLVVPFFRPSVLPFRDAQSSVMHGRFWE